MADARQLVDQLRADLKPLDGGIVRHPYLDALEAGKVPRTALQAFAGQQYHILTSDLRSIALLVSRHGALPSRPFLLNVLQGEAAALDALPAFAAALGLGPADLEASEPQPAGHAYCAFVAWLALYGSDAELAAAFLVNFAAWGANCGRMSRALQPLYGLAKAELAFFDLFAKFPPFAAEALAVIQGGLDRGIPAARVHRAARLLQGYELLFWDAMAEAAGLGGNR
jgi:pyrroloquinoline quinone (PQQ) biosynthesis protein C